MNDENEALKSDRHRNTASADRVSRAVNDRAVTENRELSDAERIEMFRMQHFQHVLPDLPKIPGYHVVWLSTNNQADTIHRREMLGYTPLTESDVAGWNFHKSSMKTGDAGTGLITINEMVAYKIPENLYQAFMTEAHHRGPNGMDEKLIMDTEAMKEQAKRNKTYLETFEGNNDLEDGLHQKSPTFQ